MIGFAVLLALLAGAMAAYDWITHGTAPLWWSVLQLAICVVALGCLVLG